MKISKVILSIAVAVIVLTSLSGCGAKYVDGVYKAELTEYASSGWKDFVEVTIEDGKVHSVSWDATFKDDTIPIRKKQYSKSGLYGMLAGGASEEWYDQSIAAGDFILKNGIDALNISADGYTDAVSSCTINVAALDSLFRDCLEQAKK